MPFHNHGECEQEGNVDTDENSLNHEDCEIDKSHDETDHSYSDQYEDAGKDEEEQTTGDEKVDSHIGEDTTVEKEQNQDDPVPSSNRNSLLAKDTYLRLRDSDVSPQSHSSHKRRISGSNYFIIYKYVSLKTNIMSMSGNDDTVFVDISKKKKTRTNSMLTDKQREKLSHREADIPLMYNSLDSQNPNLPVNAETLEKQELAEKTVNQENSSQLPQDEYDPPLNQESEGNALLILSNNYR
ncbi:hypothetical protein BKA69DRAFT_257403 [Paraphysoderma sedebokerense]|nr:hypothetical protein BKA69DRAFT_257403 [Paraphysoderma sedebokerense]